MGLGDAGVGLIERPVGARRARGRRREGQEEGEAEGELNGWARHHDVRPRL
jgi:hypothetical protein